MPLSFPKPSFGHFIPIQVGKKAATGPLVAFRRYGVGVEKFGRFKVNSPMPGSSTGGAVAEGSSALPGEPRIFGAQAPAVSFFLGGKVGGQAPGTGFWGKSWAQSI